jgi:hypothetical protein
MLVRPELGPTLPALVRRRFARPERVLIGAAVGAVLLAAAVLVPLLSRGGGLDGKAQLVHRSEPVFNLLYTPGDVRVVEPRAGELARLHARGHGIDAEIVVRPLQLPEYRGNISGVLPIVAYRDAILPARGATLLEEGKARFNKAPGYQVRLRTSPQTTTRIVYLLPGDSGVRDGVRISLRQTGPGRAPDDATKALATSVKKAFRSFRFGTSRK